MTEQPNLLDQIELDDLRERNKRLEVMIRDKEQLQLKYNRLYGYLGKWMTEINDVGDIVPKGFTDEERYDLLEQFVIHGCNFMEMTAMIQKNATVGDAFKKFMVALRMAGYDEQRTDD